MRPWVTDEHRYMHTHDAGMSFNGYIVNCIWYTVCRIPFLQLESDGVFVHGTMLLATATTAAF